MAVAREMAVAQSDLPTAEDLLACFRRCQELKLIMKDRQAGGRDVSGRYKKHDSARLKFISTSIEPGLKMGKMPTAYDYRMLFDMPAQETLGRGDTRLMDAWADSISPDPRSRKARAAAALDEETQTSLLRWAHLEGAFFTSAGPEYGRRGRPPAFKFGLNFGKAPIAGMTIDEVVRKKLGWVVHFFCCDPTAVSARTHSSRALRVSLVRANVAQDWDFCRKEWQVDLYNELWRREECGETLMYYHFDQQIEYPVVLSAHAREEVGLSVARARCRCHRRARAPSARAR